MRLKSGPGVELRKRDSHGPITGFILAPLRRSFANSREPSRELIGRTALVFAVAHAQFHFSTFVLSILPDFYIGMSSIYRYSALLDAFVDTDTGFYHYFRILGRRFETFEMRCDISCEKRCQI